MRHPLDGNAIAADVHHDQPDEIGHEEGDLCRRDGCCGRMQLDEPENCSCHINPPCHECENLGVVCDTCGEIGD